MSERPSLQPSTVLAAYAEPLIDGQRVVVFGDSTAGLGEHALERGARIVHVYDTDPGRAAEAAAHNRSPNLWFAPLGTGDLALRERSFEVAIIENAAAHADLAQLLRRARRTLSGRGAAFIASPNPDVTLRLLPRSAREQGTTLDYYALYDLASAQFPCVRMLGQMPFVGYTIADFGTEREPEPTFDAGFVPGGAEEPEWFVVLASEHPLRLDEFAVIQLSFRGALGSSSNAALEQQLWSAQQAERRARERLAELEATRQRAFEPNARALPGAPDAARRELEKRDAWIKKLEDRASTADARADATQTELDEEREHNAELRRLLEAAHARVSELERRVPEAPPAPPAAAPAVLEKAPDAPDLDAIRAEAVALADARVSELESRIAERERREAELMARVAELSRTDDTDVANEISGLESQLAERARELRRLERDLTEAERIGRELVFELEALRVATGLDSTPVAAAELAAHAAPDTEHAELRRKLDALAALNAEREADLTAARWTIEKLEARLEEADRPALQPGDQPALKSPPLEQELATAQAELQRQAVLIEQLRARSGDLSPEPDGRGEHAERGPEEVGAR